MLLRILGILGLGVLSAGMLLAASFWSRETASSVLSEMQRDRAQYFATGWTIMFIFFAAATVGAILRLLPQSDVLDRFDD
jgi:cell division protein FtsW (lipid II flippase)